jgi:hypothetical protein
VLAATLVLLIATPAALGADAVYWGNAFDANKISFANLDTSAGGDLATTGATVAGPAGVAIDPAAGRIYWANFGGQISFANLDGTGGGDLATTGATVNGPFGVAVDRAAGRIYWANSAGANKISFAKLDGSGGGGDLATTGATVNAPIGVAIDPAAGRIYWANFNGNKISFANLNGTGGGDLATFAATVSKPLFPALLRAPSGAGAPAISGGSALGSTLACSRGSWAPDLVGSFLYRAPRGFAFRWLRDGSQIAGATQSSITASSPGDYRCRVTATNHAGSASQTSAPAHIEPSNDIEPSNEFSFGKVKRNKRKGTAQLSVKIPGAGALELAKAKKVKGATKSADSAGEVKLPIKPKGKAKKKLNTKGKAKVKAEVTYTPEGGEPNTEDKKIKLVKR